MNLCYCNRATHYIRFISPWCYELCTFFFYFFNQSVFFACYVCQALNSMVFEERIFFFSHYFVWVIPSQRAKTLWIWNNWHFLKSYFVWMSQMYSDQISFNDIPMWIIDASIGSIQSFIWSDPSIRSVFAVELIYEKKILFCSFFFLWLSESKCSSNPP